MCDEVIFLFHLAEGPVIFRAWVAGCTGNWHRDLVSRPPGQRMCPVAKVAATREATVPQGSEFDHAPGHRSMTSEEGCK